MMQSNSNEQGNQKCVQGRARVCLTAQQHMRAMSIVEQCYGVILRVAAAASILLCTLQTLDIRLMIYYT